LSTLILSLVNIDLIVRFLYAVAVAMSLPVSAGDVIAVSILIKDVIKARDNSRGSAAEYQEVVREL
jgi:hypothetical protein